MTGPDITAPDDGGPVTRADGSTVVDRARVERDRAERTKAYPPLPGLSWSPSYNVDGDLVEWTLVVQRDRYDAFAPRSDFHDRATAAPSPEALGELAYLTWIKASSFAFVSATPMPFEKLIHEARSAWIACGMALWQQAENHGYTNALERTLPSARLGAAGELDDMAEMVRAHLRLHHHQALLPHHVVEVVSLLLDRVTELRRDGAQARAREQKREGRR